MPNRTIHVLALPVALLLTLIYCQCEDRREKEVTSTEVQIGAEKFAERRERMVREQLERRDIRDPRVLAAMRKVPREKFVPADFWSDAYEDGPLPIGHGQTISQPYIVAYMTESVGLKGHEKVLEIGTGSGYQAAILAELAREVYSIEIVDPLARRAKQALEALGYKNVHVKVGNGYEGWQEFAPFDAIVVTAAPEKIPQTLVDQLSVGGRMIAPVGSWTQTLVRVVKTQKGVTHEELLPVRFVPMVREKETVH